VLGGQFLLQDILRQGFTLLANYPSAVTRVFDGLPPAKSTEAQAWLTAQAAAIATRPGVITLGMPNRPIQELAVSICQDRSPEDLQFVGSGVQPDQQQVTQGWSKATLFRPTFRIVCLAADDFETSLFLQLAVGWVLLYARESLQSPDYGYGLMEQRLDLSDMGHVEYLDAEFGFATTVTLHAAIFAETNTSDTLITSATYVEQTLFVDSAGQVYSDTTT
jgi:hypothetical protein